MALSILSCPVGTRPSPEPVPPSALPSVRGTGFGGRWRQATLQSPVGPFRRTEVRDEETLVCADAQQRSCVGLESGKGGRSTAESHSQRMRPSL